MRTLLALKIQVVLIVFFSMQLNANVFLQSSSIYFNIKDVPTLDVLLENEKNGDIKILENHYHLSIQVENTSLEKTLGILSKDTDAKSTVFENNGVQIRTKEFQQGIVVSGVIEDGFSGEPLMGVNVIIEGTTSGVVSDDKGRYSIEVMDTTATLSFSMIGYITETISVHNQTTIDVVLIPNIQSLGEIVVVGYGTRKKSDLTGSISSLKSTDIKEVPSSNVISSLQGKTAGMYITQSSGQPGGTGLNVQIRGLKSLTASNEPLYVIDGLPLTAGSNIIGEMNPNDIVSIDILKDASAASIYGSRGANGVVLITTKRGLEGKVRVQYNSYFGSSEVANKLDLFSGPEWLELRREAYRAENLESSDEAILDPIQLEVANSGEWVDWQEEMFQKGAVQNHYINILGGSEILQMNLGLGSYKEKGVYNSSDYKRYSVRLNTDYKATKKFKIGTNFQFSRSIEDLTGTGTTLTPAAYVPNASGLSVLQPPASKIRNDEGDLNLFVSDERFIKNPLFLIQESLNERFSNRLIAHAFGVYEFMPGLSYKLSGGLEYRGQVLGQYQTKAYNDGGDNFASLGYGEGLNYTIENIVNYKQKFLTNHDLHFTLLYGIQSNKEESLTTLSRDLPNDFHGYNSVHEGTKVQTPQRFYDEYQLESYMGRINYSFMEKYLLTLTGRIDGSSKFGAGNKYGFFPSAAFAWKMEKEPFISQITAIDQCKLRLSYGTIGNQEIESFRSLAQAQTFRYSFNGAVVAGLNSGTLANPDLKWETTRQFNVGLDLILLKNQLEGTLEYYNSNIEDLLLTRSISSANGYTSILDNIGETKNSGIELSLTARIIRAETADGFWWTAKGNFAAERNEIVATSFFDENGNPQDDLANRWFIGEPILVNYDYVFDGIWQTGEDNALDPSAEPGDIKVKDLDDDGEISATNDRKVIGTPQPDWYGGLKNTFTYKGFDLNIFIITRQGVQRLNQQYNRGLQGRFNSLVVDYWTPENPSNTFHRPQLSEEFPQYGESMVYQDASYTALKSVNLGYSFPENIVSRIKLSSLRIYVTGLNLKYWTKFDSYNPESDFDAYPITKSWLFGLNVGF